MCKANSLIMATRLKQLREERKLSHVSLSAALKRDYGIDISRDSLMSYEVSDPNHSKVYKNEGMRVEYLRCLSDFYNVSSDYLLGLTNDRSKNPAAVDDLGLSESAVDQIMSTRNTRGFENCIPGLNLLIENGNILVLAALAYRFRESVRRARDIERSYSEGTRYLSEATYKRDQSNLFIRQHLEEIISEKYPELKGQFGVLIGEYAIRNQKADIVKSFEEMLCSISGYNHYLDEIVFRNTH